MFIPENKKQLVRVLSFKFQETASQAEVDAVVNAFCALPSKIPQITSFEWGTDASPEDEKRNRGLTHNFRLTFAGERERDVYRAHLEHQAFVQLLLPILADGITLDYWTQT